MAVPTPPEPNAVRAAAFLAQALALADDPAALAPELTRLRRDPAVAVYSAELDSSVGPTAFLVYAYDLAQRDAEGRTGWERYDHDLRTLEEAAERDAPGPRLLASAHGEGDAFLLATTPATLRALSGEAPPEGTGEGTPPPVGDPAETRREAAGHLLRLLREADAEAATWLAAVAAEAPPAASGARGEADASPTAARGMDQVVFDDVETELALFLLDERSIRTLLRVINLFLTAARRQAADALTGEHGGASGGR